jgi:hypothetical protein
MFTKNLQTATKSGIIVLVLGISPDAKRCLYVTGFKLKEIFRWVHQLEEMQAVSARAQRPHWHLEAHFSWWGQVSTSALNLGEAGLRNN